MKSSVFFSLSFALLFFASCDNEADPTQELVIQEIQEQEIQETWNLKNVNGGMIGLNIDYNSGEVIWTFQESTNKLIIQNNIESTGPEDIYAGLDSGTYDYEILEENESQVLYIDGSLRGVLLITNSTLTIDDGIAADGYITSFEATTTN
jgi:hypothetical protein